MRLYNSARSLLKWIGLILSLLLMAAWAVSIPYRCLYITTMRSGAVLATGIMSGNLVFLEYSNGLAPLLPRGSEWNLQPVEPEVRWAPIWDNRPGASMLGMPLWIPFLLAAIPTAFLFWRDRRRIPSGHCLRCRYDLTGNTSGVCPECGTAISPTSAGPETS